MRFRRRGVFICHVSCRVPDTDSQPHPKAGLKAHVSFSDSVTCPPGMNSHEPKSRFPPVMCWTGMVSRGWPGREDSIFMLTKCQHLIFLMWIADEELSGIITIWLFFFFASEKETFQFFGVRVRVGHLECPMIKQTKLRHQWWSTSTGSMLTLALMTKDFEVSHTHTHTHQNERWLQNVWVYYRPESKGHIAKYNSSLLNLFQGKEGGGELGQPGVPLSCARSRF